MNISFDLKAITDMMSIAEAFLSFLYATGNTDSGTLRTRDTVLVFWSRRRCSKMEIRYGTGSRGPKHAAFAREVFSCLLIRPLLLEHSPAELRFAGIHAASKQSQSESDRKRTRHRREQKTSTMFKNIDLLHLAALKGCLHPNSSYGPVNLPISVHLVWLRYEDLKEPLVSLKSLAPKQGREAFQHFFARDNPVPAGNIDSGLTWMEAGPASKWMYKCQQCQVLDFPRLPCWSVR